MTAHTLAIIPARGGSKRIPGKNLKEVAEKPLLAHTIHQADKAGEIDRTIVSTDDEEIAAVAEQYDGEVPFMRPAELATDTASTTDVVTHAVEWAAKQPTQFDRICVLQVTSPLRTPADINNAVQLLDTKEAASVVSISAYDNPPQWAIEEDDNGYLREFFDTGSLWTDNLDRTQDIPELCYPNGAIFAATTDAWRTHESFYTPQTVGYRMPRERSFDIDEPWELKLVRNMME
jgi:N-acylneuraminate cytidylyltransferase